jgi:UDP-N-acetylglucosamine--N-acetylmuramyl-(pentapeptide) pyrophosphoryl-undecaprenol N-acetylglucosamine transferase
VFPAIAVAEQLSSGPSNYQIEWLGVPDRLETTLVPDSYRLHMIGVEGFQKRDLSALRVLWKFGRSIFQVRRILKQGQFQGVFTTGGYIAAPAVIAARSLGLPVILHESNALPGKVTRGLSGWCTTVAVGFEAATKYLPRARTVCVGTPVRSQFLQASAIDDLPIPPDVPLIVVVGGSQGAVAVNKLVRQCAPAWLQAGIWIVHLTGDSDPDAKTLHHPHYLALPFYHNMAGLLRRATLVISRAGAGTLTELAIAAAPAILIPYPFAAEDHQTYNAQAFVQAGAALLERQADLTPDPFSTQVLELIRSPETLQAMSERMQSLAVLDSADRLATLLHQTIAASVREK